MAKLNGNHRTPPDTHWHCSFGEKERDENEEISLRCPHSKRGLHRGPQRWSCTMRMAQKFLVITPPRISLGEEKLEKGGPHTSRCPNTPWMRGQML